MFWWVCGWVLSIYKAPASNALAGTGLREVIGGGAGRISKGDCDGTLMGSIIGVIETAKGEIAW
jgi:hypothetical protein